MNTPAHLILGAAVFGRPAQRGTRAAALIGSLVPDLSLYLMAGIALGVLQIPPQVVFDELYFSDAWQAVFRVDNSLLLWGIGLGLALWRRAPVAVAFAGAGLLHLVGDFVLHNDDARAHLWPLTDWRFISPVSYWDSRHNAHIAAPILALMTVVAGVYCIRRDRTWAWALLWVVLIGMELFTLRNWMMFF